MSCNNALNTDRHDHNFYMRNILNAYHSKPQKIKAFVEHSQKQMKSHSKSPVGVIKKSQNYISKISCKNHMNNSFYGNQKLGGKLLKQKQQQCDNNDNDYQVNNYNEDMNIFKIKLNTETPIHYYKQQKSLSRNSKLLLKKNFNSVTYSKSIKENNKIDDLNFDKSITNVINQCEIENKLQQVNNQQDLFKYQSQQPFLTHRNTCNFKYLKFDTTIKVKQSRLIQSNTNSQKQSAKNLLQQNKQLNQYTIDSDIKTKQQNKKPLNHMFKESIAIFNSDYPEELTTPKNNNNLIIQNLNIRKSLSPSYEFRKNKLMTIQETSYLSGTKNIKTNENIVPVSKIIELNQQLNNNQYQNNFINKLPTSLLTSRQNTNVLNTNTNSPKNNQYSNNINNNIQLKQQLNLIATPNGIICNDQANTNNIQSKFVMNNQQRLKIRKKSTTASSIGNSGYGGATSMSRSRIKVRHQIFQQNEKLLQEIINRFKQFKGVNTLKGMLQLDKKQIKAYFNKQINTILNSNNTQNNQQQQTQQHQQQSQLQTDNQSKNDNTNNQQQQDNTYSQTVHQNSNISGYYKNCQGVQELLNAFLDHMFKDKSRLDLDQFKQYFFEELASENPQVLMETAFSFYENLAFKKHNNNIVNDLNLKQPLNANTNKNKLLKMQTVSPTQMDKNILLQQQLQQQQQLRNLTDIDLYKIIELPCFNLLHNDVSAIVRGINIVKQSNQLQLNNDMSSFKANIDYQNNLQQYQSQLQQQSSNTNNGGTIINTQNSSPAKLKLTSYNINKQNFNNNNNNFNIGLKTSRNLESTTVNKTMQNFLKQKSQIRPQTTHCHNQEDINQILINRYSKNWFLTGQDRSILTNSLLTLKESKLQQQNNNDTKQRAQTATISNQIDGQFKLNIPLLNLNENKHQIVNQTMQNRNIQTAQTSRQHIKLSSILFSQCAKKSYRKFDTQRIQTQEISSNYNSGFNTARHHSNNKHLENLNEYCACDWELRKQEKNPDLIKYPRFTLQRPKSMSQMQRYNKSLQDNGDQTKSHRYNSGFGGFQQRIQKLKNQTQAWQMPERESKINLIDYLKKVKFLHNSGTPDIILLAIQLLYGEPALNLFMQMVLGMETQNFVIEKWPMFQRKTYDKNAQILQDLLTQNEEKTEILVIRRDFSKFITTKIFRLGVLSMLKDFHESPHGTVSYCYIPDKLGNKLTLDIDQTFIGKVQLLFAQLCDPKLNNGTGITLPYLISQSNLLFGKHQPYLAERLYRYLEMKQTQFIKEYIELFNQLNNFLTHTKSHIEYQVFLDFCYDCQRKTKVPFDNLDITFWLYAQDQSDQITCKDLQKLLQSENWNLISQDFEKEINMLLQYILQKAKLNKQELGSTLLSQGKVFDIEKLMLINQGTYKQLMKDKFGQEYLNLGGPPLIQLICSQIENVTEAIIKYDEVANNNQQQQQQYSNHNNNISLVNTSLPINN